MIDLTRRAFFKLGTRIAAATVLPALAAGAHAAESAARRPLPPLAGGFSREAFTAYEGQEFAAVAEDGSGAISLRLERVSGEPALEGAALECFDVRFHCGEGTAAGVYNLYHPAAGVFQLRLEPSRHAAEHVVAPFSLLRQG